MPFNIGLPELIIILVIAFVVFGAGKLPSAGKAIGQSIREFKVSLKGEEDEKNQVITSQVVGVENKNVN